MAQDYARDTAQLAANHVPNAMSDEQTNTASPVSVALSRTAARTEPEAVHADGAYKDTVTLLVRNIGANGTINFFFPKKPTSMFNAANGMRQ